VIYDAITNIIAKTIALVAPGYARDYLRNHRVCRAYEASKTTGPNRNFRPAQASGAQEIESSWLTVTNKTRALVRDNSHVAGMTRRFVAALVGEGSWPRPKILKKSAANAFDFESEINRQILARWEVWAADACANGDSVYQLQRIAASAFFIDGGLLIRKIVKNRRMMLEPIELDQLDRLKDTDDNSKIRIVGGKELDEYNKPVAYWIKKRFPTEYDNVSERVLAAEIIDIFDRDRASSVGGISRLAPSVMNFHNIGKYRADTMSMARTALGFGVFVQTEFPEDNFASTASADTDPDGREYEFITPGGIHYLRPGESINQVKPENPGTQYEPFLRAELRGASVGAGMSYESVSNDGSQTNFSGTRQMLLFERALTRYTFAIFEEKFYSRVYRWFIEFEKDFGKPVLNLPGYEQDPNRFLRCAWSRPKTEWVDPLKDAKAAKEEIAMGVNTLTEFCETAGRDIEEVVATRKYEKELFEKAGITSELSGNVAQPAAAPVNNDEVIDNA
jgi:lambda family phage portal protein